MKIRRNRYPGSSRVNTHLMDHLGDPFAAMEGEGNARSIGILGYADVPQVGQVILVTSGLAALARKLGFARNDGYAQELLIAIDGSYLNDNFLGFFHALTQVYVEQRSLLEWFGPIRLSSPIPGALEMSHLCPAPAAIFDSSFQFIDEIGGRSNFCLLVPVRTQEAEALAGMSAEKANAEFGRLNPNIWDLRRPGMAL